MTTDAPALRSTDRLLELAKYHEQWAGPWLPEKVTSRHLNAIAQQHIDVAAALRALVKAREFIAAYTNELPTVGTPVARIAMQEIAAELTAILGDGGAT